MTTYKNIPTNIISGFLGAGKTTAIQSLLKQKPESEIWAVIVNEFGQIGIDGALLKNDDVEIKEIAGGCLCCVGSQSLSVGLNQIIRSIKPQRIIIEPTGLGHPAKLIDSLTGEFYQTVLDLKAVINLLDARQLSDEKYTKNEIFIDQSNLADILIASKLDTYSEEDKQLFTDYAMGFESPKLKVVMVEQGRLQLDWLDLPRSQNRPVAYPELHNTNQAHQHVDGACDIVANNVNWFMVEGHANGYFSVGWRVAGESVFSKQKLHSFIKNALDTGVIERVKGVLHVEDSWIQINSTRNEFQVSIQTELIYSILEFISSQSINLESLDSGLKECRI
ncbi:MAG: GTP-binding protein [endosymbiont of Galathealinum brachiosum]|uniref:GTP-binding protein n=1 Tax=endosymbiont of Galathealinum brachiosum TaxID=2200906 RepID=A0A370DJC2_9GAMM|nr:MAG: GTP-binding protein [endosymbiont of Galathealinum brachiosum]